MTIEVCFKNKDAQTANGLRQWVNHVRQTVAKKMQEGSITMIGVEGNTTKYQCADTVAHFTVQVKTSPSGDNLVIITLDAFKKDGTPARAAPIPALVILLVVIYLLPGRENAGKLIPMTGRVGSQQFSQDRDVPTIRAFFLALKTLCPDDWYLPFAEGVDDSAQFFAKSTK
ncbi:hypothetical protein Dxin01_00098 [Deinococcus xinjiangensis]|uniref:Uncharacterized protein n=1 Tax=Deinococcus xinjiangensis TaxID=457454 RepID=A0ABP9V9L3_9DEIO